MEWDPASAWILRAAMARTPNPVAHAHTAHAAGTAVMAGIGRDFVGVMHRRVDFPFSSWSARFKYGLADRVVAVSSAIKRVMVRAGLDAARIEVVCDGVAATEEERRWTAGLPSFSPASSQEKAALRRSLSEEFSIPEGGFWIGNLAALVPHKDHDTLLAAALLVVHKNLRAYFLVAGQGPEEACLLEQVKRLNLLGRVFFLGQREDAPALLRALDIFVLSSWGEGMGSVLLEASACRLPIAATTAGGIPEIVEDGRSGLLCRPRDPEGLSRNILSLMDSPALSQSLADEALGRLPRFGLARMAERMEEVYGAA